MFTANTYQRKLAAIKHQNESVDTSISRVPWRRNTWKEFWFGCAVQRNAMKLRQEDIRNCFRKRTGASLESIAWSIPQNECVCRTIVAFLWWLCLRSSIIDYRLSIIYDCIVRYEIIFVKCLWKIYQNFLYGCPNTFSALLFPCKKSLSQSAFVSFNLQAHPFVFIGFLASWLLHRSGKVDKRIRIMLFYV